MIVPLADVVEDSWTKLAAENEAEALKELVEDALEAQRKVVKARCKEAFERARKQHQRMRAQA